MSSVHAEFVEEAQGKIRALQKDIEFITERRDAPDSDTKAPSFPAFFYQQERIGRNKAEIRVIEQELQIKELESQVEHLRSLNSEVLNRARDKILYLQNSVEHEKKQKVEIAEAYMNLKDSVQGKKETNQSDRKIQFLMGKAKKCEEEFDELHQRLDEIDEKLEKAHIKDQKLVKDAQNTITNWFSNFLSGDRFEQRMALADEALKQRFEAGAELTPEQTIARALSSIQKWKSELKYKSSSTSSSFKTPSKIVMAQTVPPGDILTQPNSKIVFNAPFDYTHTYHIKVINSSARRIAYAIKTTNMKRFEVDAPCGVLDPNEAVLVAVSCDAFAYGQEDTSNDSITVEWTNTPDGAAKQFRREWFQGDGLVRRKNLPIEYNP